MWRGIQFDHSPTGSLSACPAGMDHDNDYERIASESLKMAEGLFFSFDGIDGAGKSTQLDLFCRWLESSGHQVVRCRDPGSTRLGEGLRQIVLRGEMPIDARSETLIYMAARAQLVAEIIAPALSDGKTVVSDRYLLANVVYQAYGLDLCPQEIWGLGKFTTQGIYPDLTFVLDMDVRLAAERIGVDADRLETRNADYHQRVRDGFLAEAKLHPSVIRVIAADQPIDGVQQSIRNAAATVLSERRGVPDS